jgi:signal transduction histidine kinase
LNEQQVEFVQRIQSASATMNELVQNLLDLAKMDAGMELKKEIVNIHELLAEVVDEFGPQTQAKNQTLTLSKSESQLQVQAEPFQLKQALRNLVGNAIKYTPNNGTVSLSVVMDQYNALVRVKDTGYGIPAKDLPHIFDRFYRVRDESVKDLEGNGLGLAIVKSIIEGHGGQISVESELGKGSCFCVSLPILAEMEFDLPGLPPISNANLSG